MIRAHTAIWSPVTCSALGVVLLSCTGTSPDTDTDTDTDPPIEGLWSWCEQNPTLGSPSEGEVQLEILNDALFCSASTDNLTFSDALAFKSQVRFIPGQYGLPSSSGTYSATLPACLYWGEGRERANLNGEGHMEVGNWGTSRYYSINQPLLSPDGEPWTLNLLVTTAPSGEATYNLTGSLPTEPGGLMSQRIDLCPSEVVGIDGCSGSQTPFYTCDYDQLGADLHTIAFEGGEVALSFHKDTFGIGDGTEPSEFSRATGTLDGTPFDQQDFFQLLYSPTHHHFNRSFGVLFDDPIEEACGLLVEHIDPWSSEPSATVGVLACPAEDLVVLETRNVTSETTEQVPGGESR